MVAFFPSFTRLPWKHVLSETGFRARFKISGQTAFSQNDWNHIFLLLWKKAESKKWWYLLAGEFFCAQVGMFGTWQQMLMTRFRFLELWRKIWRDFSSQQIGQLLFIGYGLRTDYVEKFWFYFFWIWEKQIMFGSKNLCDGPGAKKFQ
jgi:hypothetical protein